MTQNATSGFSMIEMLISAAILLVMIGLMTLAFHKVIAKQKFTKEITIITTELEKARDSAFFGRKPTDPDCQILTGVAVTVHTQANNPRLTIETICDDDNNKGYDEKTVPLDPDIEITSNPGDVLFASATQTTNLTGPMEIRVEADNGDFEIIQVSQSGKIGN